MVTRPSWLKLLGSCCEGCSLLGASPEVLARQRKFDRNLRVIRELPAEGLLHLVIQNPDLQAKLSEPTAAMTTRSQHCWAHFLCSSTMMSSTRDIWGHQKKLCDAVSVGTHLWY